MRFALVHQQSITIYLQSFYPQIRFQLLKSDLKLFYLYLLSMTNSPGASTSESLDFMALYKLILHLHFNQQAQLECQFFANIFFRFDVDVFREKIATSLSAMSQKIAIPVMRFVKKLRCRFRQCPKNCDSSDVSRGYGPRDRFSRGRFPTWPFFMGTGH